MLQTFYVPAGGRIINAKGTFVRLESVTASGAAEDVRIRADGNDLGTYLPGDSFELPVECKTWEITPVTATATAVVRIGVGTVASSRIFGNVKVIDQGADKTRALGQFWASFSKAGDVANVSCVHLNPNGKTVAVKGLALQSTVAGAVMVAYGTGTGTATANEVGLLNKKIGAALSTCRVGNGLAAGTTPTGAEVPGYTAIARVYVPSNQLTPAPLTTPLVVEAGAILVVQGFAINRDISVIFDVEEL